MTAMDGVLSWKRLSIILICLAISQSLYLYYYVSSSAPFTHAPPLTPIQQHVHDRDLVDVLTQEQCDREFGGLYAEIHKSVSYWKEIGHQITAKDIEYDSWRRDGAVRILIHDNELRILSSKGTYDNKGYRLRTFSALSMLQRAIWSATAAGERLPTIEASIIVDDMTEIPSGKDRHTAWTWASTSSIPHRRQWLIPDFGFHYAPNTGSWIEARRRAA